MQTESIYPLLFNPVFKDYPWGGRNLATRLGRALPEGIIAESWEIAAHPHGSTLIQSGPLAGKTLEQIIPELGEALLGSYSEKALATGKFPLLVKLLDANRWLSVQVHPDDVYGLAHENEPGKTEMWVVLHAEPNAEVIFGFKPSVTREQYAQAIAKGHAADGLHHLPVTPGDVIFVPAGAIHALGPGIIVAEIQQNSDTTYRIYDWGRPRPIHVEQALAVLNFNLVAPGVAKPKTLIDEEGLRVELLARCPYFETQRVTLPAGHAFWGLCDGTTFEIWAILSGAATLEWDGDPMTFHGVSWTLLPAALGEFQFVAEEGSVLLRVTIPDAE